MSFEIKANRGVPNVIFSEDDIEALSPRLKEIIQNQRKIEEICCSELVLFNEAKAALQHRRFLSLQMDQTYFAIGKKE